MTNGVEWQDAQGSPWRPTSLGEPPGDQELGRYVYVVVEEKIDDVVGLLVSPWPGSRDDGRLWFHAETPEVEVAVDGEELQEKLEGRRVPRPTVAAAGGEEAIDILRTRPAEVGDVYAVLPSQPPPTPEELEHHSGRSGATMWMETIVDITADAREAAKIATYEALTPPLTEDVAEALRHETNGKAGAP